jgi:hypothetical protein
MAVSQTCAGSHVGLEQVDHGLWDVYLGPVKLGRLVEEKLRNRRSSWEAEKEECVTPVYRHICYPCPRSFTKSDIRSLSFLMLLAESIRSNGIHLLFSRFVFNLSAY